MFDYEITLKQVIDEDFINYKKPAMLLAFPCCDYKCGYALCQNRELRRSPDMTIKINKIVERYLQNNITSAIVLAGLEPFDSQLDLFCIIRKFRDYTNDDVVIYTGYNKDEIIFDLCYLKKYTNIIVKFGRYIAGQEKHFDEVLGVYLASDNQYGKDIQNENYYEF